MNQPTLNLAPLPLVAPAKVEEHPIARAIRDDLRKQLEDPLDVPTAMKLGRTLKAAVQVLKAVTPGAGALLAGANRRGNGFMGGYMGGYAQQGDEFGTDDWSGPALAGALPQETLGNTVVRDFITAIQKSIEAKNRPSVSELVGAIAVAKKEGLTEEVESLRAQLREFREGKKIDDKDAATIVSGMSQLPGDLGAAAGMGPIQVVPMVMNPAGGTF